MWPTVQADHVIALFEIPAASGGSYLSNHVDMVHVLLRFSRFDITRNGCLRRSGTLEKVCVFGQLRYHVNVVSTA